MGDLRATVSGFLTPVYVGRDNAGRVLNAFENPDDMKRISSGYACGNCCATFFNFQLECPICHLATNVSGQAQDAPQMWQDHFDEHNYGTEATKTRTPDQFLADVAKDPEIDQVKMKQLKSSRHGLGA